MKLRKQKKGNYTAEERRLILEAATSTIAGGSIKQKQDWLMLNGVHSPGNPSDPVSESAIKYWEMVHRKVKIMSEIQYDATIDSLLDSPPSYTQLRNKLPLIMSSSIMNSPGGENDE
mgnify:CR=1 FL=1